ncbi:AMP-binding protein [Mycolicibacterium pulveris]|uniref:ATP-dependent acyl-CoA ligase n=1 Tax=Mycolicibacterium pulveris TaxID=36813 RepID=A0A7I7UH46_MYCPV|nr:AMP-binding protein [Mycolicibacterium pulveris]MCV6981643.1 AMP-binding protein [Mycolicibacterium pulveris]BBY80201.1 ATP-dependent acyl-CoA ligase [Mycolicibacterium pulveris]
MTSHLIPDLLRTRAASAPDAVCCAMDDEVYTYADMDRRSDRVAAGLAALGIGPGERVATLAPNRSELLELFYGVAKSGAAQVPLNAYLKGEFLLHQLRQSRSGVLVTDTSGREALEPIRDQLPGLRTVVMLDETGAAEISYQSLRETTGPPPDIALTAADTMSILYTSGTTGLPKGCVASHGYYLRSARLIGDALEIDDTDVLLAGLPLFHAGARLVTVTMPLVFGIPAYLQGTFSASGYFPRAREVGATVMIAVGAMGAAILATEPGPADRDHSVRRIMCAPLTLESQQIFRERFGVEPWVDVFGQTECMPTTLTPLSSDRRDPKGCGIPAPDLEVALLDEDGNALEGEAEGEICIRPRVPHAMFDGYFEQPAATQEAFRGLWYHTGDFGRRLPSGALAFVDRLKDCLRRRGENISSFEVEQAINHHPAVVESAVHAVPSPLGEDDLKACLVVREPVEPAELFDFFKNSLPYFAIPRYIEFLDELPRNGVGRVLKHKLRDVGTGGNTIDFKELNLSVARDERR